MMALHSMAIFADHLGFQHHYDDAQVRWPQANRIAERLMRTIKKVYLAARVENKSGY